MICPILQFLQVIWIEIYIMIKHGGCDAWGTGIGGCHCCFSGCGSDLAGMHKGGGWCWLVVGVGW